jgi:DNA-directed RNA polymerase subunit RPC12/RpoP
MRPNEQIKQKFDIRCKKCGSSNVDIDFSAGDGFVPSPAIGWLEIECKNCDEKIEIDDDDEIFAT